MRYAINLDKSGRLLSVTEELYASKSSVIVDNFPEGNIADYIYHNGTYIYSPVPEEPEPTREPTADEILNALLGVTE